MTAKIAPQDEKVLEMIRLHGRIYRDASGLAWIEGHGVINLGRFERLLELGVLVPAHDALFPEIPSQSYTIDENRVQFLKTTAE